MILTFQLTLTPNRPYQKHLINSLYGRCTKPPIGLILAEHEGDYFNFKQLTMTDTEIIWMIVAAENKETELTPDEIKELKDARVSLLDKYGVFGGGHALNDIFSRINNLVKE